MDINSSESTFSQSDNNMRKRIAGWIATSGVALITLGLGSSTTSTTIGLILLFTGSVLVIDDMIKEIPLGSFLLPAALTLFLLCITFWAIHQLQVEIKPAWKEFRSLMKIAGLPALALGWWLLRGQLRCHHFLVLLALGVFFGCFEGISFDSVLHTPIAGRKIFTAINPNELGFLAGILFLISTISLLLDARTKAELPGSNWIWNLLFIMTAGVSGYLIIISQSRSIILGIGFALASILLLRILISRRENGQHGRRFAVITLVLLACLGLVLISPLGKVVVERFHGVGQSLSMLTSKDTEQVAKLSESLRHRIWMWQEGVSLTAEAPLIGHGLGTARSLLAKSSHPEINYQHFHSLWIHLMVVSGILGMLGFVALFAHYVIASIRGVVRHDSYMGWLSLGLWAYFIVAITAQLRINHPSGVAFVMVVGGMSFYAFSSLRKAANR